MKNMLKQMLGAAACCAICTTLPLLPASAAEVTLGDVNADSAINATDASEILVYATEVGAGTAQAALDTALADVNGDGTVNALDASDVLVYTSKTGSGYTGTMEQHIRSKKNFEYYHSISDYEVYVEMCELFDMEAQPELPELPEQGLDLPHWHIFRCYVTAEEEVYYGATPQFSIRCNDYMGGIDNYDFEEQPELFGFPEEWYYGSEPQIIYDENGEPCGYSQAHVPVLRLRLSGYGCDITTDFDNISKWEPDYVKNSYQDSIFDVYRIYLTLQNSDFYVQYANQDYVVNCIAIDG